MQPLISTKGIHMKNLTILAVCLFIMNSANADSYDTIIGGAMLYGAGSSCSAETQTLHLKAIENHLDSIVEKNQLGLGNNPTFTDFVASQKAQVNQESKIKGYLEAVGIQLNGNDLEKQTQLVEFIGARDHSSYIQYAERKLSLSEEQADFLVASMRGFIVKMAAKNKL